ncbi:hypothetical protein G6F68_021532 [Rhizopus microsporus]|nr:hypothetical protein G6F68_021532 [Rhizopus microsporus]
MLTGGAMDAEEARLRGLTRRVVPRENLAAASRTLAAELLALPHGARMLTKSVSRQSWSQPMDSAMAHEADAFALATAMPGHQRALAAAQARK